MDKKDLRKAGLDHNEEQLKRNDQKDRNSEESAKSGSRESETEKEEDFDLETADSDTLRARFRELAAQLNEAQERVLRTAADAENFKKRLEREKEEQTRYANEAIIRALLPAIDNLERAIDHSRVGPAQEGLMEGLNMTLKGFMDTLARFGCTQVEAVDKLFDPNFHEAVSQEEAEALPANTVLRELQKGYILKDRLLRPAMVVVSRPTDRGTETSQEESTDESSGSEETAVKIKIKNT